MKVIVSQNGQQVFAVDGNALFNVSAVEISTGDPDNVKTMYSVGVNGVSFGQFAKLESAVAVIDAMTAFLINQRLVKFVVALDPEPEVIVDANVTEIPPDDNSLDKPPVDTAAQEKPPAEKRDEPAPETLAEKPKNKSGK